MITEAQRRALFALREALHLCEVAEVRVAPISEETLIGLTWSGETRALNLLSSQGLTQLLAEHPE